ncbi:G5 domain-containing protein [uncultured Finegoldia sp.]|uniref:G5 domain-containing protein n=1 Tax=uncultured Finegoldia sp. TaxID=328009 RepID=UPI002611D3BF|nr:G5 domain-containing protein [uncultured Finegoldia sp.]
MKKYGEDFAIAEQEPKVRKIYDNNLRQNETQIINPGKPTIKKIHYEDINGQPTIKKEEIIEVGEDRIVKIGTKGIVDDFKNQKSDK